MWILNPDKRSQMVKLPEMYEYQDPKTLRRYTIYHFIFASLVILSVSLLFRFVDMSIAVAYDENQQQYLTANALATQEKDIENTKSAPDRLAYNVTVSQNTPQTPLIVTNVPVNNPVLPQKPEPKKTLRSYLLSDNTDIQDRINAKSYIVADLETNEILLSKNINNQYPIASITKYLTAAVALSTFELNNKVRITARDLATHGARAGLRIGDRVSLDALIYPLLLVSSNDSAEIIANYYDRDEFLGDMNSLAKNFGMLDTYFHDPTGLSEQNVSTANDLFLLLRRIKSDFPEIIFISNLRSYTAEGYTWKNINQSQSLPEFRGGKTGFTNAAKKTFIGYFTFETANQQKRDIGVVLLGSDKREEDIESILEYLKQFSIFF